MSTTTEKQESEPAKPPPQEDHKPTAEAPPPEVKQEEPKPEEAKPEMKSAVYRPTDLAGNVNPHQMPVQMPPAHHPMAMGGHHPHHPHHPILMPYPPPMMAAYPGHPPHYAMPGMPPYAYGPPPPSAHNPMPPLVPMAASKKADDSAPAGAASKEKDGKQASDSEDSNKSSGLDLLATLANKGNSNNSNDPNNKKGDNNSKGDNTMPPLFDPTNPNAAAIAILQKDQKSKRKNSRNVESPGEKIFVETVREWDVLCGRGGKSNHHLGNKRYRQVVSEMKNTYRGTGAKTAKTDLSRAIVEHVVGYGGRFVKRDSSTGQYYLLTKAEARRKTSQALRETKVLKWTM